MLGMTSSQLDRFHPKFDTMPDGCSAVERISEQLRVSFDLYLRKEDESISCSIRARDWGCA
jgi:hypothetical protein